MCLFLELREGKCALLSKCLVGVLVFIFLEAVSLAPLFEET